MAGPSNERSLASSWFEERAPVSEPVPSSAPLPVPAEGDPTWTLVCGAFGGGGGGAAMVFVANEVARRRGMDVDVIRTIGRAGRAFGSDAYVIGIAMAVVAGIVVGLAVGALMRHARRFVARILAGVLFAVVLWTLVHAFVLQSFAPATLGALPLLPMIAGASVLGLAIALVRPPRRLFVTTDEGEDE